MTRLEKYLTHLQRFGIAPGLERVAGLLQRVGDPQHQYPIVLVGGTNGKGSTCEFLARTLAQDGLRAGLYSSPHLYRWNERIRVLEKQTSTEAFAGAALEAFAGAISDDVLDELFDAALPHLQAVAADPALGQPTEFETLTFLGLWHFARTDVDVAIVEVGLGGRWDATNITQPHVSVITHVALDHCDRLGNTLEAIASDKVDIARRGRVLVTAETKPAVLEVLRHECNRRGARLWPFRAPDWCNDQLAMQDAVTTLQPSDGTAQSDESANATQAPDEAAFQHINAATARLARAALRQERPELGLQASARAIEYSVPGRLEVLRERPIVIIDGANNPDGAAHLATDLKRLRQTSDGRLLLVAGILADKDWRAMITTLAPLADVVIATQSQSPRAIQAALVAQEAATFCPQVKTVTPVQAAVQHALGLAGPHDIICVTGSFYTIAEVERSSILSV
jgi:dihydrofolate synthase/folylpolyglutamate synthase